MDRAARAFAARACGFCLSAGAWTAGCADAQGRYDEFVRGTASVDAGDGSEAGACAPPAPNLLDGPAMLAVETTLGAGLPILYAGTLTTPALGGKTQVVFEYRALDARDRQTAVGATLRVGPFPVEADGTFVAAIPEQTLPGEANPILPGVPITSALTLEASICGVRDFYCGSVFGTATRPVIGEVSGRFGLTLLADGAELPERPRYGCDPEDVAALLPGPR